MQSQPDTQLREDHNEIQKKPRKDKINDRRPIISKV